MSANNNTAVSSVEAVSAVKVIDKTTGNYTTYDITRGEAPPPLAYFSVSENEGKPGVYTEDFEYTMSYFSDMHKVTSRYGYSTMIFKDGYRKKDNVIGYGNIIIFDIDDGYIIDEARSLLKGVKHLIVTTSNHQKKKGEKPACDRFRILLQADKVINSECDSETYREIMVTILSLLGLDINKVDKNCLGADRFYKPSAVQEHWYSKGELIPLQEVTEIAIKAISARKEANRIKKAQPFTYKETKMDDVVAALNKISPDIDYGEWIKVGMALKDEYSEEGFDLWNKWSSQGQKYDSTDIEQKWSSFTGSGCSIATVFYLARG